MSTPKIYYSSKGKISLPLAVFQEYEWVECQIAVSRSKIAVSATGGKFDASVAQYVEPGYQYDEQTQTVVL